MVKIILTRDFGSITPEYVYRMWGSKMPLNEIEEAMEEERRKK